MMDLRSALVSEKFGVWPLWRQQAGLQWHHAADYYEVPSKTGTPIIAPDNGKVAYEGHGFGPVGDLGYFTIFDAGAYGILMAHQDGTYGLVGDKSIGQTIGYVGNTGWSTGPHVHCIMSVKRYANGFFNFERPAGTAVDPVAYWEHQYKDPSIFVDMFGSPVPNGVWAKVTARFVTKAEIGLLGDLGVESVWFQKSDGTWVAYNLSAPDFVNASFPNIIPQNTVVMVNRKA